MEPTCDADTGEAKTVSYTHIGEDESLPYFREADTLPNEQHSRDHQHLDLRSRQTQTPHAHDSNFPFTPNIFHEPGNDEEYYYNQLARYELQHQTAERARRLQWKTGRCTPYLWASTRDTYSTFIWEAALRERLGTGREMGHGSGIEKGSGGIESNCFKSAQWFRLLLHVTLVLMGSRV